MKRNIRPVIFALALLFQLTASQPSPAGTLCPIAISGQPAPDGNGVFATFSEPTLNNRGVVCFRASLSGHVGGNANRGIYCGVPGLVTRVARGGQQPGVLAGGEFQSMEAASGAINDTGQVAFKTGVTPVMNINTSAVFRKGAGRDSFSLFARRADPAPGEGTFDGLSDSRWRPVLGAAGHVAFQADLLGTNGGTADDKGIFRSSAVGDSVLRIVQEGEVVPGGAAPVSALGQPVVNASGQVAVPVSLGSITVYDAVVRGDGNNLVTLVRVGQVVPGFGTISHLTSQAVSMNDDGETAFCMSKSITVTPDALAVSSGPGDMNLIALIGGTVPTMSNRKWSFIESSPSINASGQTGYFGRMVNISNSGDPRDVLFLDQTAVALTEDPLPGGGGVFYSFSNMPFALNDSAQFAFKARITLEGYSGSSYGIFFHDGAGGLSEVIRRGRHLLGSTITTVDFAGSMNSEGLPPGMNGLNNAGEVAFRFELADGREGIALWSSLPKPSAGVGDITAIANGFRVRFPGISGWDYVMERDEDLLPPWERIPAPVQAGADGWVIFDDHGPGLPLRRFYRMSEAP